MTAAGQLAELPLQSAASVSSPAEQDAARHSVVEPRKRFVGHAALVPVHVSRTSQIPLTARQTAPEFPGVCVQPVAGSQASTVHGLVSTQFTAGPPLQTPELQVSPEVQALPSLHETVFRFTQLPLPLHD
jgi:hypothetical protein